MSSLPAKMWALCPVKFDRDWLPLLLSGIVEQTVLKIVTVHVYGPAGITVHIRHIYFIANLGVRLDSKLFSAISEK